ncbi:MAG: phosphoenolpyruvate synthase [bacterium]|nr:phosphoenolpyruvate synthase [bacterium]
MSQPWVLPLSKISKSDIDLAGGKGANLGEMIRNNFPVPNGFVVTAPAYLAFIKINKLESKIQKLLSNFNLDDVNQLDKAAQKIQRLILDSPFPEKLAQQILASYQKLDSKISGSTKVAIRSSATAEDLPDASFAGQQATFLNVSGEKGVIDAVQKCWASLFTPRAIFYRQTKGFSSRRIGIAVIVQKMVQPRSSGIMFTINPVTNNKQEIIIEATFGLGELIVQGSVTPDHFVIDKKSFTIIKAKKGSQDKMMVYGAKKNIIKKLTPAQSKKFKISQQEALDLAKLGRKLENHYLAPQDIEWAIEDDGRIYIVQTRPITTVFQVDQKLKQKAPVLGQPDLVGSPASPGVGMGQAKIITDSKDAADFQKGQILVARMTSPDLVPIMKKSNAILTQEGGLTSHAAIVSRELGKPCIVGIEGLLDKVKNGDYLTIDANKGHIYFGRKSIDHKTRFYRPDKSSTTTTKTKVYVNLSDPDLAHKIAKYNVDGVGLLRAEFMIINQFKTHPKLLIKNGKSQDFVNKMAKSIARFAKAFFPRPVVYRATDFKTNEYRHMAGGQKFEPLEANPMLGFRGAHRYISDGSVFDLELQAIKKVRQSGLTNLHLMIPFVRKIEEVAQIKQKLAKKDMKTGQGFWLWVMVEVPSMVILIDKLMASGIQGVSIGTNDLTMLTLGVDRDSHDVASLYDELDPAVLSSVQKVIKAGLKHKVTVSVCGQAPSVYEEFAEKIVKWGVTSVSVSPDRIEATRQLIHQIETNS